MAEESPGKAAGSPDESELQAAKSVLARAAEAARARRRAWRLLPALALLLGMGIGIWSLLARQLPWLTALSILAVVCLGIVAFSRVFRPPAQRLWGILLILAVSLYFASLSYQAWKPARESRYLAWTTPQPPKDTADQVIAIAYPRLVPLEAPDEPGWPLSVYLWPPVLRATPTTTATVSSATSAITPTTAGQVISYTIAFEPYDDGLLFTDQEGAPVPPQVMVKTGQPVDEPAVLYVRRAPVDAVPASVPVKVQVYGVDGNPHELTTLDVRPEDAYSAWWRHFWGLVLGPTTPLLALAAALVGFGWQWWQEEQKKKWNSEQERRRRREERLAESELVRSLALQGRLREAAEKLLEVSHNIEHVWEKDDELIARLAEVRKYLETQPWRQRLYYEGLQMLSQEKADEAGRVAKILLKLAPDFSSVSDLQLAAEMQRAFYDSPERWLRKIEEVGIECVLAGLLRVSREGGPNIHPILAKMLADLTGRSKYVEAVSKHLGQDSSGLQLLRDPVFEQPLKQSEADRSASKEAREAARWLIFRRQSPFVWPDLWLKERPPDLAAIAAWLTEGGTDLKFNPFGPGRGEDDSKLPELFVEPPQWEQMKAPGPTVIFGAEGSGRTASCLMLAHTCTTTRLGRERTAAQVDTFPVHLTFVPGGKPEEAGLTYWRTLTRALAQATLDFLVLNPQSFGETPFHQQRALARLFAMHREYLGDLIRYLEGVGLDRARAIQLSKDIRRAGQGTRPPALDDEAELLFTLAKARLFPFQRCYVLAEIPDQAVPQLSPEEIVPHLSPLMQVMQRLAARKVYVKVFVSAKVLNFLKPLPPRVDAVELAWERPALREMLEWRAKQAGVASFRQMFRRLPRGIDAAERLVQAAFESEGPPRRLIQLGQELLTEHIRRDPTEPQLSWEALKAVLDRASQEGVA
jgi:hypothetical protein